MIKQDAAKYTDFCHHIEGYGSFSPWLDEYDPLTKRVGRKMPPFRVA